MGIYDECINGLEFLNHFICICRENNIDSEMAIYSCLTVLIIVRFIVDVYSYHENIFTYIISIYIYLYKLKTNFNFYCLLRINDSLDLISFSCRFWKMQFNCRLPLKNRLRPLEVYY